ncbi:MAG: glycosyltransferase [Chitinophagales bacterium]|nr:glycosyltransferase [Chitinophagales bacterium]
MSDIFTVCFPIGFYYPAEGGPNNSIYWIAKALTRKGIPVRSISMDKDIPKSIARNIWHNTNYGTAMYVHSSNYILGIRYVLKTLHFKRKSNIILHLTSIFAPTSILIALMYTTIYPNVKLIWSARGELDPAALIYRNKIKNLLISIHKFLFSQKVTYHATCIEELNYIQQAIKPHNNSILIPNFIDLPTLISTTKKDYILYLGRIHPKKAIENLISAFAMMKYRNSGITLQIAGEYNNNYTKLLLELISKLNLNAKVEFVGHIEGLEKQRLIAGAKALILPSHSENFGNVVVEALAQKTPVIASKGTPWEILEQHNAGFWVENSPLGLATAIDRLLDLDETSYQNMCDNALELVSAEFEVNRNIDKWINAYQKAINNEAN